MKIGDSVYTPRFCMAQIDAIFAITEETMGRSKIHRVSSKELTDVIDRRAPIRLFLTKEGRKWVAVDNSTGDAWTEEFSRKSQAVRWLWGKFEVC